VKDNYPNEESRRRSYGSAMGCYLVAPHLTDELPARPISVLCTVSGNVRMLFANGDDVTIPVVAGQELFCRPVRIVAGDTTATLYAFW
jgi:hypothetical protein